LLDSLLPLPEDASMEDWYMVMIEKIYNLTLATRLTKAMAEKCAVQGSSRVRAWLECYLTVIYFYQGDYIKCLQYYEKSLSLPEEEQDWLSRHCMGAYAAKTYQLTGQEERSIPLMESEISRLRRLGLYDELSLNYLIYAEILLTEEIRKLSQGSFADFLAFRRYLEMAEEHAALNRSTEDYLLFAKILLIRPNKALHDVKDIL